MIEGEIARIQGTIHRDGNVTVPNIAFRNSSWQGLNNLTQTLTHQRGKKKKEKPRLLCNRCRYLITHNDCATSVAGLFRHTFINPAGVPYQIGCFSSAQGCFLVGEPTLEFTWFPGYTWCYAMCDKCLNHLGWYYQSGDHHFYGLILNRLIDAI